MGVMLWAMLPMTRENAVIANLNDKNEVMWFFNQYIREVDCMDFFVWRKENGVVCVSFRDPDQHFLLEIHEEPFKAVILAHELVCLQARAAE